MRTHESNGLGAMIVTHGVGTLSAVNGIAGAYSEHVPKATDLRFGGVSECCDIELQPQVSPLAARFRSASDKVGMLWRRLRIRNLRMR